jgi:putative hydrolase of the HAD superfamily
MITHIYFDWSGTLAEAGSKDRLLYSETKTQKRATLSPGLEEMLHRLVLRGYTLGIISNTSKPKDLFIKALRDCDILHYFKGTIVLSTEPSMVRKPDPCMFHYALSLDKVSAQHALMVGNDLEKDIQGGKSAGLATLHIHTPSSLTEQVYTYLQY